MLEREFRAPSPHSLSEGGKRCGVRRLSTRRSLVRRLVGAAFLATNFTPHRYRISAYFAILGVWRGWNAPNPIINQSSNLVPTASAHRVASKLPFASKTWTVAGPELPFPVTSTVVSPEMIDQPVRTYELLKLKSLKRNA